MDKLDNVQKNFLVAAAIFALISCMVVSAILGISYFMQPPEENGTVPQSGSVAPMDGGYNGSNASGLSRNFSGTGGSNMTEEEIIGARERIKEENAVTLFVLKAKYGLSDGEVDGLIDTFLRDGKNAGLEYLTNLSKTHPGIAEDLGKYNESDGDLGAIMG